MKIYHHNDLDGRCAAAIVLRERGNKDSEPDPELTELDYKDPAKDPIDFSSIQKGEIVFVVDFSFKPEAMEKLLKITKDVIWIDHHKTAFEYKYSKDLEGIRNASFSACELTWQYFTGGYHPPTPQVVRLIGDWDTWTFKFEEQTRLFHTGLLSYDTNPKNPIWDKLLCPDSSDVRGLIDNIKKEGAVCIKFRDQFLEDYAVSYGFEVEFEGRLCFAFPLYKFGSDGFGKRIKEYPICISFVYSGDGWTIGLYSKTIDVAEIAKKYEGGGHTGAAGFECEKMPSFLKLRKR